MLVITNVQLADAGAYRLSVTNPLGHAESGQAVLTVYSPPIILQQPQSQRVVQGDTVSFIVGASGTPPPLRYAWSFNGVGVPGQTNASIVLTNVQLRNAGVYKVSVTTIFDSVVSSNAILSVLLDSDGDHMPDVWESANGFNSNDPTDAALDADNDSMTNLQEYLAGTDPHNPRSYLKIDQIKADGPSAQISFFAVSNRTYALLYKDSPGDPKWLSLTNLLSHASNRVATLIDSHPPGQRFLSVGNPSAALIHRSRNGIGRRRF